MADEETPAGDAGTTALQEALAAEHAAVWGYGVVGAALPDRRAAAVAAENSHRAVRDRLIVLLTDRSADPVPAEGGYRLPFPVASPADAAALAVVLEEGAAAAWVGVLDRAPRAEDRQLAVEELAAAEVRAVGWRSPAGRSTVTTAFPGLPGA